MKLSMIHSASETKTSLIALKTCLTTFSKHDQTTVACFRPPRQQRVSRLSENLKFKMSETRIDLEVTLI